MSDKEKSFEQALIELEDIAKRLESGEETLDSTIALFEKGIGLSKICSDKLSEAKQKIDML